MAFVRALLVFLAQLAAGVLVAVAIAALWAVAHGGGFRHSLQVGLYLVGALSLLFGALGLGGMSPSQGLMQTSGRIPGMRAVTRTSPGTTAVNATPIFFLTGGVLIALAVFF